MNRLNQIFQFFTNLDFDWIGPFSHTMIATFVGAGFAFFLQNVREKRQERKEEIRTFNQAVITLAQMHNELANYKKQAILPFLDKHIPFIEMWPIVLGDLNHLRIHADKFAFMSTSSNGMVPFRAGFADLLFIRAVASIGDRVSYHINTLQPALVSNFALDDTPSIEALEQKLGPIIVLTIKSHTYAMIDDVNNALNEIEKLIEILRVTGDSRYGNGKTITYAAENNRDLEPDVTT